MDKTVGADAAKLAGLQIDLLQKLRAGQVSNFQLEWWLGLSKDARDKLCGVISSDDRFGLADEFELTVPANYDHATQLASFRKKFGNRFANIVATDAKYRHATTRLAPGQKLIVKIIALKKSVNSDDCLSLLGSEKALLVGAQGLSLIYELAKSHFKKSGGYISLDERDALWADDRDTPRVPYLKSTSHYDASLISFYSIDFAERWVGGTQCEDYQNFLICVCDAPIKPVEKPTETEMKTAPPAEAASPAPVAEAPAKMTLTTEAICPTCYRPLETSAKAETTPKKCATPKTNEVASVS